MLRNLPHHASKHLAALAIATTPDCQGYGKGQINIFLVEAAERRGISVRGGTTVLQLFTATNNNNRIGLSLKLGTLTSLFLLIGLMDRFAPAPQGFLQKRIVGIDVIF